MKNSIMIAATLVLIIILMYQPPQRGFTQSLNKDSVKKEYKLPDSSTLMDKEAIKLMDSIKSISIKLDSSTVHCRKRLSLLKSQQKSLSQKLDTLTFLTVRNE